MAGSTDGLSAISPSFFINFYPLFFAESLDFQGFMHFFARFTKKNILSKAGKLYFSNLGNAQNLKLRLPVSSCKMRCKQNK